MEPCTVDTADELTDLLSRLKDQGVTHVVTDPTPRYGDADHVPIDRLILDIQLSG